MTWDLIDKVSSDIDNTIKYLLSKDNFVVEVSYINKEDGKDIICMPTQTSCNLGCKFCHLTGLNLTTKSLDKFSIFELAQHVISDIALKHDTLLISYMGAGEPLMNIDGVIGSAQFIKDAYVKDYKKVRFAVASIVPKGSLMLEFMTKVKEKSLNFKFHLSLHNVEDSKRKSLMPKSSSIKESLTLLNQYSQEVGDTEIHYTLMKGVNDSVETAEKLTEILEGINTTVKLLKFSPKESEELQASDNELTFIAKLQELGVRTELYLPPGRDIGSSCGQFNVDRYVRK